MENIASSTLYEILSTIEVLSAVSSAARLGLLNINFASLAYVN